MSQRFGRNQKRAMRAQIASAEAVAAERLRMAEYSRTEAKYVRDELDEAKEIAGRMSILFPATSMEMDRKQRYVQIPEVNDWQSLSILAEDMDNTSKACIKVHTLPVLLANIQRDPLRRAFHVAVEFDGGEWGYALTREAIASMPLADLTRLIAYRLAPMIAAEMKRGPR